MGVRVNPGKRPPIATFHPTRLEGLGHRIGYIEINSDLGTLVTHAGDRFKLDPNDEQRLRDLIIITTLTMQERSEEHRIAVWPIERSLTDRLVGGDARRDSAGWRTLIFG